MAQGNTWRLQKLKLGKHSIFSTGDKEYEVLGYVGHGAFGDVYKVQNGNEIFALKDIVVNDQTYVQREMQTMRTVAGNKNIVKIIGTGFCSFGSDQHALILMEYLSGGNLNDYLDRESRRAQNLKWIYQISDALRFLHSKGIIHRDIKGDNILLTGLFSRDAKLGDFGMARFFSGGEAGWYGYYSRLYAMSPDAGPIHSMAPEVFNGYNYTEKIDVFSLGTVVCAIFGRDYIMYKGKRRYGAFAEIPGLGRVGLGCAMAKLNRPIQPDVAHLSDCSGGMIRLIQDTLKFQPTERPSMEDIFHRAESLREAFLLEHPEERDKCCSS